MHHTWLIGSADACDIRVASPYVSARHCRLELDGRQWTLEDLGSTNGTFVNGQRCVARRIVSPSDRITLGTAEPLPWPEVPGRAAAAGAAGSLRLPRASRPLVIGRAPDCDIVLDAPMVSSRHAAVEPAGDGWIIRDLGSTNGTFVAGRAVRDGALVHAGDVIGLGSHRLTISADGRTLERNAPGGRLAIEAREVTVEAGPRRLIQNVSLAVRPGELVAIMGPSGAGKSTLLAAIAGCRRPDAGRVLLSGADLYARFDEFRGQVGYVPQDDIMHTDLTVWQALWYAARLRLPRDYSRAEIRRRVESAIERLGLQGTERVRIGSPDRRGISGGQRKRVNVALELITDPPILVLDEPTSGLSSTDALSLMQLLRDLADSGKAILLTIHQPGVEVMRLLDGLAVVARDDSTSQVGELVWYGPAHPDAAIFFEPDATTPDADSVLRGLTRRPVAAWQATYRDTTAHARWLTARRSQPGPAPTSGRRRVVSLLDGVSQWRVLAQRMLAIKAADPWSTAVLLLQAPVIGLLVQIVFAARMHAVPTRDTWPDISQAVAATCFLLGLAAVWCGCANAARELVAERAIFRRERMVGLELGPYLASKLVVLGVLAAMQCAALLLVGGRGLESGLAGPFATLFLAAGAATALGLCISTLARSTEAAAGLLPIVILPMVILGGILVPLGDLPAPTTLLADALPSRWAFEGLVVPEAGCRPLLEVPISDPPPDSGLDLPRPRPGSVWHDMAEVWFPAGGGRSRPGVPAGMLLATWLVLVVALMTLARRRDRSEGR